MKELKDKFMNLSFADRVRVVLYLSTVFVIMFFLGSLQVISTKWVFGLFTTTTVVFFAWAVYASVILSVVSVFTAAFDKLNQMLK